MHTLAFTRAELEAAEEALRSFRRQHPDYPEDAERFHGWFVLREGILERERQAHALGLSTEEVTERDELLRSTLWDGTADKDDLYDEQRLLHVSDRVLQWLRRFPNDPSALHCLDSIRNDLDVVAILKESVPQDLVLV
jgi:hypothetical protein